MARIEAEVGKPQGGFMKWIDDRFPFTETMKYHATEVLRVEELQHGGTCLAYWRWSCWSSSC